MTGYRAFSRDFVKTYPVLSKGFEIETEMTIHALDKNFYIEEIPVNYKDREEGSESKLNTVSDGIKVIAPGSFQGNTGITDVFLPDADACILD